MLPPRSVSRFAAAGVLVTSALLPAGAAAQTLGGLALDTFDPAPAGDAFFGVRSPATPGHLVPRFAVAFDYAKDPLRLGTGGAIVSEQGFLHVGASLSLFDRVLVSANMPFALLQAGANPVIGGVRLRSPDSAELGDLRLGARVRLLGDFRDPFQLALGADVHVPTAGDDSFAGEGAPRVAPHLVVGGRAGSSVGFLWSATGGAMLRTSDNPQLVTFGAAAGLTFADELLQIGPELYGATQVGDGEPLQSPALTVRSASHTNLELLGGAKLRVLEGLTFGAAGGPGLAGGVGTPTYRVVGLVAWAPLPSKNQGPPDDDGDGVPNETDACPKQKGIKNDDASKNGCPPPDRDGDGISDPFDACPDQKGRPNADATRNGCPADYDRDGIPDDADACPNQKGVASRDPARNGCPGDVDTDLDGVADRVDACPTVKGVASQDPARNGCPLVKIGDRDGDGIADDVDACPDERGKPSADAAQNGCPIRAVHVAQGPLDVPTIHFDFGSSAIAMRSQGDMEKIRATMASRRDVVRIEVQGHADEVGNANFNQVLSERRAAEVVRWLVARGIERNRLVAKGYGASQPVTAATADERNRKNRRVEFVILEKK